MSSHPQLCPLNLAEDQELKAKAYGFYWKSINQILEQIQSECKEVQEAYDNNDKTHLQEEIGDLMQAAVCLAVYCQLNPQETLKKSIDKFQKRYDLVVQLAKADGLENLHDQSTEFLLNYWKRAKKLTEIKLNP